MNWLKRIFTRSSPNLPVLVPLPGNGHAYVWPQDRAFRWGTTKAGALFYTQGDDHIDRSKVK